MRNKIPRISNEEVITAFSTGVSDIKMREKLSVNDELTSVVRLLEIADRCAKAEEGRLFVHNVDGFRVTRTWGTTRRTQGFERRGLNV
jgi:hypothetical protein